VMRLNEDGCCHEYGMWGFLEFQVIIMLFNLKLMSYDVNLTSKLC
jgi:hypothetical protein